MKAVAFVLDITHWQDSQIHEISDIARSLRFKRYNALASMRAVINSGGYLGMAIPTIKRHDLVVARKSQHANHAIMETQNIRTISYNAPGYLYTVSPLKKWIPIGP